MKKGLLLLAMLSMLMFIACSKDDDDDSKAYEDKLIGLWIEKTDDVIEVHHMDLKENNIGYFWITDDGEIYGEKENIICSATKTKFTSTFNNEETENFDYQLVKDTLYLGEIVYVRKQISQPEQSLDK